MARENTKMKADGLIKLSVPYLRKNGFFKGLVSGDIPVVYDRSMITYIDSLLAEGAVIPKDNTVIPRVVTESSYHILVSILDKDAPYVHFSYASPQPNGEYKNFGYYVDLVATKCRHGGLRYWFKCPLTIDGKFCGRRVEVLYKGNDFFGCRYCFNLTYQSRSSKGPYIDMGLVAAARDIRYQRYYRGKPTRKFRRALKMDKRFKELLDILNREDSKTKEMREKIEKLVQKERSLIDEAQKHRIDSSGRSAGDTPAEDIKSKID